MLATVLHVEDLLMTIVASVIAGVGITVIFSTAIWGGSRFVDLNGEGRTGAAWAAALVGLLALVASLGMVGAGIFVMTSG